MSESGEEENKAAWLNRADSQTVPTAEEPIVRQFVEHWGKMARAWGINSSMGELFALLYIQGSEWTADSLREYLRVSRGNVSMNLRELMAWGVVHKVIHPGERREFFRAETNVWILFQCILTERKKRELEPTLNLLESSLGMIESEAVNQREIRERLRTLRVFFEQIDALASRLLSLEKDDLDALYRMVKES